MKEKTPRVTREEDVAAWEVLLESSFSTRDRASGARQGVNT